MSAPRRFERRPPLLYCACCGTRNPTCRVVGLEELREDAARWLIGWPLCAKCQARLCVPTA